MYCKFVFRMDKGHHHNVLVLYYNIKHSNIIFLYNKLKKKYIQFVADDVDWTAKLLWISTATARIANWTLNAMLSEQKQKKNVLIFFFKNAKLSKKIKLTTVCSEYSLRTDKLYVWWCYKIEINKISIWKIEYFRFKNV